MRGANGSSMKESRLQTSNTINDKDLVNTSEEVYTATILGADETLWSACL